MIKIDETANQCLLEDYKQFAEVYDQINQTVAAISSGVVNPRVAIAKYDELLLEYLGLPISPSIKSYMIKAGKSGKLSDYTSLLEVATEKFFHRSYVIPGDFLPYNKLSDYYGSILMFLHKALLNGAASPMDAYSSASILRSLLKNELPFLLVDNSTMELLQYVDVHPIHWDAIHMPFDAFTVVFPKEQAILFNYEDPAGRKQVRIHGMTFKKMVDAPENGKLGPCMVVNCFHDGINSRSCAFNYSITTDTEGVISDRGVYDPENYLVVANRHIPTWVLRILLVMHARPESVIHNDSKPRSSYGKNKHLVNVYNPKMLVLPKIKTMDKDGKELDEEAVNSRPKMHRHIVRGHLRNQPHGPRNSLRKVKCIMPYWKCVDNPL